MAVYRSSFVDPYPNGWKDLPVQLTPIDAAALQAMCDGIKAIDNYLDGVNKDLIGNVKRMILTKSEYEALPDTKYVDGVLYVITDEGGPINYENYEQEVF